MAKNSVNKLVDTLEDFFAKAPNLPTNAREMLVQFTPWIALVFGIVGILSALASLGVLTVFAPLAAIGKVSGMSGVGTGIISALLWLVSSALLLAAFPGTKNRKRNGWDLLFWSGIVNLIGTVIAGAIVSGIIGAIITFYLLFQIKSYYK